ncbi:MAG: SCP2 sterol-binding domain-containing protein [Paracoccaceae bacterium]
MSDVISKAVDALSTKFSGGFDAVAKFVVTGEGAIMVDATGVRAADEEAEVTLTAGAEDFQAMFEGDLSPTSAFMTGRLRVEGNMGLAMKLAAILA